MYSIMTLSPHPIHTTAHLSSKPLCLIISDVFPTHRAGRVRSRYVCAALTHARTLLRARRTDRALRTTDRTPPPALHAPRVYAHSFVHARSSQVWVLHALAFAHSLPPICIHTSTREWWPNTTARVPTRARVRESAGKRGPLSSQLSGRRARASESEYVRASIRKLPGRECVRERVGSRACLRACADKPHKAVHRLCADEKPHCKKPRAA